MPPKHPPRVKDPLLLWWMPVVALIAPLIAALWLGATAEDDGLRAAVRGFFWPGAAVYLITFAVLWAGWKIDLE